MITKLYRFHHLIQYDLNKNALIVPLKQSIIKAITLPPQDHVSGRVMAYPLRRERGTMPRGGSS